MVFYSSWLKILIFWQSNMTTPPKNNAWTAHRTGWIVAVSLLILFGIGYRLCASFLGGYVTGPIILPVPLKNFPMEVNGWTGQNAPLSEAVKKVAGNDDYLSRLYTHQASNKWANIYVAYSARPRTMLGHRPQVCYPNAGWIHDKTDHIKVTTQAGRVIPCLLHKFHNPNSLQNEVVVLNFYILNGQVTDDESGFNSVGFRTPNIKGDIARYVTQVQISSSLEDSVQKAVGDFADRILAYFPDENGNVKVATENEADLQLSE